MPSWSPPATSSARSRSYVSPTQRANARRATAARGRTWAPSPRAQCRRPTRSAAARPPARRSD
eukprot:2634062-Alexandrium_andersonii.AAC.1